jgi:hypothetical protein
MKDGSFSNQRECKRMVNLKPRGVAEVRTVHNLFTTFLVPRSSLFFARQYCAEVTGYILKARFPVQWSSRLKSLNEHTRCFLGTIAAENGHNSRSCHDDSIAVSVGGDGSFPHVVTGSMANRKVRP